MTRELALQRGEARGEERRRGVVVRGHDDGVGGMQDERQHEAPVPLEQARLPVHADDIHLILQHQARCGRASGAPPAARRCRRTGSGRAARSKRPARATTCGRQAALPRRNSGVSSTTSTPGGRRRGVGPVRGEHRDVDAGLRQRPRLVVGHRTHAAPIGGKNRGDVRDSHASTYTSNQLAAAPCAGESHPVAPAGRRSSLRIPPPPRRYQLPAEGVNAVDVDRSASLRP